MFLRVRTLVRQRFALNQ